MKENKVIFRRVNGRVIPIRVTDKTKDLASGGALTAAGIGTAMGAGKVAAELTQKSAGLANVAKHFDRAADFALTDDRINRSRRLGHLAVKFGRSAEKTYKGAQIAKHAGFALSSALIGVGFDQFLKQTPLHDDEKTRGVAAGVAATGAAFALQAPYIRRLGGVKGFKLIRQAAKKAFSKVL